MYTPPRTTCPLRHCASALAGASIDSAATPATTRMGRYFFERTQAPFPDRTRALILMSNQYAKDYAPFCQIFLAEWPLGCHPGATPCDGVRTRRIWLTVLPLHPMSPERRIAVLY